MFGSGIYGLVCCGLTIREPTVGKLPGSVDKSSKDGMSLDLIGSRDQGTKTDWSRTERFGPGPRTRPGLEKNLGPDQDQ